jgi:hypothetical protein
VRASGTVTYAAPEGQHDDLVLALGRALRVRRPSPGGDAEAVHHGSQAGLFESRLDLSYLRTEYKAAGRYTCNPMLQRATV